MRCLILLWLMLTAVATAAWFDDHAVDEAWVVRTTTTKPKPTTTKPTVKPTTVTPTTTPAPGPVTAKEWIDKVVASNGCVDFASKVCEACVKTKILFDSLGANNVKVIELETLVTSPTGAEVRSALILSTGSNLTPYVYISGKYVGGYDQLALLHSKGQLLPMLQAAGCIAGGPTTTPQPTTAAPTTSLSPTPAPTTTIPGTCPLTCKTCYWPKGDECLGTRVTKNDCAVFMESHSTKWCGA